MEETMKFSVDAQWHRFDIGIGLDFSRPREIAVALGPLTFVVTFKEARKW
jgi:hypothetical protein